MGGMNWCLVVVTVMVVLLPGATEDGLAEQVVAAAGREQENETLEAKPSMAATAMVYVAELPELTVAGADSGARVKSGPLTKTVAGGPEVVAG
jgi:hypothetical protein